MPKIQTLAPILLTAALAVAPACETVHGDHELALRPSNHVASLGSDIPHSTRARARERQLYEATRDILEVSLPEVRRLEQKLRDDLEALELPVVLAASQPDLRRWGDPARDAHRARVAELFTEHEAALERLRDAAWAEAVTVAQSMAPTRSPMDSGITGDALLDRTLVTYEETLERSFNFELLEADRSEWMLAKNELFEVYSTFGDASASGFDGRLTLFVSANELSDRPKGVLVLTLPEGVSAEDRGFFQALRHRVMRGPALVQDEGWRPANQGVPAVEVYGNHLLATGIAPRVQDEVEAFGQLKDKSVVVDGQSAVFDENGQVLGGIDWRLTFRITSRGDVAWLVDGGRPKFNATCDEAQAIIDAARL